MAGLERRLGASSLWVKRDDISAVPYGGNKPRKLEFLLGAAKARGACTLITFGGLGSNHVLATAIYGRRHGFRVTAILVPQPVDDHVRQNLALVRRYATGVLYAGGKAGAIGHAVWAWVVAAARDRQLPYLIPPGGSSPVGTLGYVSGGLELADQVSRGELPAPEVVFVAAGSNGTAAGLLLGFRLAGLPSRLVAVRVSDSLPVSAGAIARLASDTAALLSALGVRPSLRFGPADLEVSEGYLGPGYGYPTSEGNRAVGMLAETEGLLLDQTYTGKTMAALLDALELADWRSRAVLYWHTYNSQPVGPLLAMA